MTVHAHPLDAHLPAFEDVVNEAYLDRVLHQGRLYGQPHPSAVRKDGDWTTPTFASITRFGEDKGILPYDGFAFPELDPHQQAAVRAAFVAWLPFRFAYVRESILADTTMVDGCIRVLRALHLDPKALEALCSNTSTCGLGSFWSRHAPDTHWGHGANGVRVTLTGVVDPQSVDWITTFHQNMDYLYGDEEAEVFIPAGAPITLTAVRAVKRDVPFVESNRTA